MKIDELKEAISSGHEDKALQLCDELYNDVRDFSQCIDVIEKDGTVDIKMHHDRTGSWTREMKQKVQSWVGGHQIC